jgi:hypothetical protein
MKKKHNKSTHIKSGGYFLDVDKGVLALYNHHLAVSESPSNDKSPCNDSVIILN